MEELTLAVMDGGSLPFVLMELVFNGRAAHEWLDRIHSRPAAAEPHRDTDASRQERRQREDRFARLRAWGGSLSTPCR